MNLEVVEERCLQVLSQANDALVPVARLLEHCHRDEALRELSLGQLMEFLEEHHEIQVVPDPAEMIIGTLPSDAPVRPAMGPRAVLRSRVPTARTLTLLLLEQLDHLRAGLVASIELAQADGDEARVQQLREAQTRAVTLFERARGLAARQDTGE